MEFHLTMSRTDTVGIRPPPLPFGGFMPTVPFQAFIPFGESTLVVKCLAIVMYELHGGLSHDAMAW